MQQCAGESEDLSCAIDGDGYIPVLIAFLCRREKMLAPILLPGDRPAEKHRSRRNDGLLGIKRRLGPEAAANVGRDDPDRLEVSFQ